MVIINDGDRALTRKFVL